MKKEEFTTVTEYDKVQNLVRSWGAKDLVFSMFETTTEALTAKDPWIINTVNLESPEPAFTGRVRFETDYWRVTDDIAATPVLENPTWKEVILAIDELLQEGDGLGVFLENLTLEQTTPDGIRVFDITIGS